MTPEEITQIIDILAERLGPMAEVVWAAYVRQVYINAIGYLLIALALLATGALLAWLGRWLFKQSLDASSYDRTDYLLGVVGCSVGSVAFFLMALLPLTAALCIFNPEYHAIQALLGR